jgi:hypothetical protein
VAAIAQGLQHGGERGGFDADRGRQRIGRREGALLGQLRSAGRQTLERIDAHGERTGEPIAGGMHRCRIVLGMRHETDRAPCRRRWRSAAAMQRQQHLREPGGARILHRPNPDADAADLQAEFGERTPVGFRERRELLADRTARQRAERLRKLVRKPARGPLERRVLERDQRTQRLVALRFEPGEQAPANALAQRPVEELAVGHFDARPQRMIAGCQFRNRLAAPCSI